VLDGSCEIPAHDLDQREPAETPDSFPGIDEAPGMRRRGSEIGHRRVELQATEVLQAGGELDVGRQIVVSVAVGELARFVEQGQSAIEVEGVETHLGEQADDLSSASLVALRSLQQFIE
jgi:hypothetical protein